MNFLYSHVGEGKPEDLEDLSLPYAGANRFRFEGFVLSLQGTPSELASSKISSRFTGSQKENRTVKAILSTNLGGGAEVLLS